MKITIITPLYNSERFIERLRDSIISQGHLDLIEWILIDDASSKESVEKVSSLLKDQLISTSLYQLPVNSGGGVPTAFGISKAKGELLIKIDHDDELVPNAISTILGDYDDLEDKHDICGMLYRSIDPNTNKVLKSGSAIPKGKLFSFSDKNNVFKDHSDTFEVYITDVIRQFWTPEYMNKATLSTPVLFKMSRFKPFVSMGDIGLLKYHRDNPNSQTNHIRVSKNTVHTYSEVFNQFDYKYFLRPIFYLKTAV
ncbi:glycosyltransferase family 2 protein, partial [Vibrio sp. 10N.222.54.B11]|uniref:glycosyltransferase family 2 protein n=1 Tax=Vibrio sp. 10N.222.54.B11 TaxID=3229635 RepID=UPI0035531693